MDRVAISSVMHANQLALSSFRKKLFLFVAILLLGCGTALRAYHLGARSMWYDEAVTANASRGSLRQVLSETRRFSAPLLHPFILYLVERIGRSSVAVRAPSVVASLIAILAMLSMVRANVNHVAALLSAGILTFSASQIRYAQEVREYSLAVMCSAVLLLCLLRWEAQGSRSGHPYSLYAALFAAPLVQYGLVLLAFGILLTVAINLISKRDTSFKLSRLLIATAALAVGGLLSYFLTLRYQLQPGKTQWYLAANYFDPGSEGVLHFLRRNFMGLLSFEMPGRTIDICIAFAIGAFCIMQGLSKKLNTITIVAIASLSINICASMVRFYPWGGIRQCLFLAPVIALLVGVSVVDLTQRVKGHKRTVAAVGLSAVLLFSLIEGIVKESPYQEFEDTLSLLRKLDRSIEPNDQVWVNHDAVAAFEFYRPEKDPRFIYGRFHADPKDYIPELRGSLDYQRNRLWLVFSHLEQPSDLAEEELIVNSLRPEWEVREVTAATNSALFLGERRASP